MICDWCLATIGDTYDDTVFRIGAYVVSKETDDHDLGMDFCSFDHVALWAAEQAEKRTG